MQRNNNLVYLIITALISVPAFLILVSFFTRIKTGSAVIVFVGTLLFAIAGLCRRIKADSIVTNKIKRRVIVKKAIDVHID